MDFAHLHNHTSFSVLDGFATPEKLVGRAAELGMSSVAITDHGNMLGVPDFFRAAKAAGVKPIIGMETYMAARTMQDRDAQMDKQSSHQLLLAMDDTGYKNLLKIASAAQMDGFYYRPRIDTDFLVAHSDGLIATTGCFAGQVPRAIQRGDLAGAENLLALYKQVFGDRYYVELQQHPGVPELAAVNVKLAEYARKFGFKMVVTNDVHYVSPEDAEAQDAMLAVQTGAHLGDEGRFRMSGASYYLKTLDEMAALFTGAEDALATTNEIAERCNVDISPKGYLLPKFPAPGGDSQAYLRQLCEQGMHERYGESPSEDRRARLEYELDVIHRMGFDDYFLIVWDLINYARKSGIWYNARGSAAGSIVAYALGITTICPVQFDLIFERFLNPGRVSMPDIDLDFQDDRRAEVMAYTVERYGSDRVASIITYGRMLAKAAVRDIGRVMNIDLPTVDKLSKMIPTNASIAQAIDQVEDLRKARDADPRIRHLLEMAARVENNIRSVGTHAAGLVITPDAAVNHVALHRPTSTSGDIPVQQVVQADMGAVDWLGLLKVDYLGLSTLTVMNIACQFIKARHGKAYDLANIPTDDPASYKMLGDGDTVGVFQVESAGMRKYLREMHPHNLENIIAMVALYRPGPMDFIPGYIKRMHGEEPVEHRHPEMASIFDSTYGIPIYQEQIMNAAVKLAGYTQSEADDLRKAISKKKADAVAKHRKKFIEGAVKRGIAESVAGDIFTDWENFARYGFNRSHAAAYGVVSVQTAFLKTHYPVEYFTALLTTFKDNQKKTTNYMADARQHGIALLPPDINKSEVDFGIETAPGGPAIRFGLAGVKNVGAAARSVVAGRQDGAPYRGLVDLIRRSGLGKRPLESLIKVGALDAFGSRAGLLAALETAQKAAKRAAKQAEGQMALMAMPEQANEVPVPDKPDDADQLLEWELELTGQYLSGHPMERIDASFVSHTIGELEDAAGEGVVVCGLLTKLKPYTTKNGSPMGFAILDGLDGQVDLVIFPAAWRTAGECLRDGAVVIVEGRVDAKDEGSVSLLASKVTEYNPEAGKNAQAPRRDAARPSAERPPSSTAPFDGADEDRPPRWFSLEIASDDIHAASQILARLHQRPGADKLAVFIQSGSLILQVSVQGGLTITEDARAAMRAIGTLEEEVDEENQTHLGR